MMYSYSWQMIVIVLAISVGGFLLRKLFSLMRDNKNALEDGMEKRFDRIDATDTAQTAAIEKLSEKVHAVEVSQLERTADMGDRFVRREEHVMALSTIQISLLNMNSKMNRFFEGVK